MRRQFLFLIFIAAIVLAGCSKDDEAASPLCLDGDWACVGEMDCGVVRYDYSDVSGTLSFLPDSTVKHMSFEESVRFDPDKGRIFGYLPKDRKEKFSRYGVVAKRYLLAGYLEIIFLSSDRIYVESLGVFARMNGSLPVRD